MTLYVIFKAGSILVSSLGAILLLQVSWLALRHGRLYKPLLMRMIQDVVRRRYGISVAAEQEVQWQKWVKPAGWMMLVAALMMLLVLRAETLELIRYFQ